MKNELQAALHDITEQLESNKIMFCLVGGLASSLRGRIRNTEDVDLVIAVGVDAAIEFLNNLPENLFRPFFPEVELVARTSFILALEHVPTQIPLDLAIGLSGFEQQIVERAQPLVIAERGVPVATAEDLILMKCLAGRPQDMQDISGIVQVQRNSIDWNYCEVIARQLEEAIDISLVETIKKLRQ